MEHKETFQTLVFIQLKKTSKRLAQCFLTISYTSTNGVFSSHQIQCKAPLDIYQSYWFFDDIFFNLVVPSYATLSTAAATVSVPPTIAHSPAKNPMNDLLRSSLFTTFSGEISYFLLADWIGFGGVHNLRMRRKYQEYLLGHEESPCDLLLEHHRPSDFYDDS